MQLNIGQESGDLAGSGQCIRCEGVEAGHLETRQTISNAIIDPRYVFSSKSKVKQKGLESNQTDKIHNSGDFGVLGRQDCNCCLVVAKETYPLICP